MRQNYQEELQLPEPPQHWTTLKLDLNKQNRKKFEDYQIGYSRDIARFSAPATSP
jgi:hypothetical protein